MDIDHVHFYVEDAERFRDWFIRTMGFQALGGAHSHQIRREVVQSGSVYFVLSSPLADSGPVAEYLRCHPPGVVDLAFRVKDVAAMVAQAIAAGAKVLQPVQTETQTQGQLKWGQIQGWGMLRHTLLERSGNTPLLPSQLSPSSLAVIPEGHPLENFSRSADTQLTFAGIDHVVLNVTDQNLNTAVAWYQKVLGFQPDRTFEIQTHRSALRSKTLIHPDGSVQFPINEPASPNSQIQEFLDANQGPGVQHIALRTGNITQAIAQLRKRGLSFLEIPVNYYTHLRQGLKDLSLKLNWQAIERHQILVDWQARDPEAILLQTFTQPIFDQPTFFFEVIERRCQAQGFGEGNFLALFEAIEREQIKRGNLA